MKKNYFQATRKIATKIQNGSIPSTNAFVDVSRVLESDFTSHRIYPLHTMSRLKGYIDGKLKYCDIIHPSKIPTPPPRPRHCITYYMNSNKYELYPDTKLRNFNRRVESKVAAYINGETTARDLVHPSKFPELSNEVLRQKLQKNRMLQSQQRTNTQHARLKSTDWIDLGKQLEAQYAVHREPHSQIAVYDQQDAQPERDLIPLNRSVAAKLPDQAPVSQEAPQNTVVFNGNVNILCISVNAQNQTTDRICDDIKRELQMLNTYTILPGSEHPQLTEPELPDQQLQCSSTATDVDQSCRILQAVAQTAQNSNVHELVAIVNELLPTVQTLRNQYKQVLADCKELNMERKILLRHQEISDKTISLLSEETRELKERNEQLTESSEHAIHRLCTETRALKEKNLQLQQNLEQLQQSERELFDVNRVLLRELQRKANEQNNLRCLLANVKQNLQTKLASLDRCFDTINECIERTELQVEDLRTNCGCTEKEVLVNTIKKLDEQNSNLMGKVKHMPEKIKNILNHISGTMSSLEEQNIRLLRTLQNSEHETFFENNFLRRINEVC